MIKVVFKNNSNLVINEWLVSVYQRDFKTGKPIIDVMRIPLALIPNQTQIVELNEKHVFARYSKITYYKDEFGDIRKKTKLRKGWKSPLEGKFPTVKFINCGSKSLGISDPTEIVAHDIPADIIIEKVIHPRSEWAPYSEVIIDTRKQNVNNELTDSHYIRQAYVKEKKLRPKKELDMLRRLQEEASEIDRKFKAVYRPLRIQSTRNYVSPKLEI